MENFKNREFYLEYVTSSPPFLFILIAKIQDRRCKKTGYVVGANNKKDGHVDEGKGIKKGVAHNS